ncbi:MAG: hypothetical protein QNJ71_11640, partial [Acidimicrobiia bacterium]|nr:hypothetical protein [Acidimicrobiia bacterium]
QQLATEIDRLIDAAVAEPELADARAKLGVANALARRWNRDHEPADAFAERSEVWLLSKRARRPAD